ncbi:MAG: hypothetical protein D6707_12935, partial [Bacteroidetes bacterium]
MLNFKTKFTAVQLKAILYTDNGQWLPENNPMSLFASAGIGFLKFTPYTDILDKNGYTYYYQPDGRILNTPQSQENSVELTRDFVYETSISDTSSVNFSTTAFQIPLTIGLNYRFSKHLHARASTSLNLTFSDYLDGYSANNNNDLTAAISVQLFYSIFKEDFDKSQKPVSSKELNALITEDSDGDGIIDTEDVCPLTPKGAEIDEKGCPIDSDGDGIADYMDKEPHSPKDAYVNKDGVALTEEMVLEHYLEFIDSTSTTKNMITTYEKSPQEQIKEIYNSMNQNQNWYNPAILHQKYPSGFEFM